MRARARDGCAGCSCAARAASRVAPWTGHFESLLRGGVVAVKVAATHDADKHVVLTTR